MSFGIFTAIRMGSQLLPEPRTQLVNLWRLRNPSRIDDYVTQVMFDGSGRFTQPLVGWQIQGNYLTIQDSLKGIVIPNATVNLTPDLINGVANTTQQSVNLADVLFGYASGANVILIVANQNNPLQNFTYQMNTTDLQDWLETFNAATENIVMSGSFGACTTNTQLFNYDVNVACTLQLQFNNGTGWIPQQNQSVSAGASSVTFAFSTGDATLGTAMRVVAILAGNQYYSIVTDQFACTGGTASGSGTPGDCTMYAYFDGDNGGWNNTTKTLNVGNTCSEGYNIVIATQSDFATDKITDDFNTISHENALPYLATGTYYARVRNLGGQTAWSQVLTFVVS